MLLGSINLYARTVGAIGATYVVNKMGRKKSLIISLILNTTAWIMITYFSYNIEILYVGRIFSGVACGKFFFLITTTNKISIG